MFVFSLPHPFSIIIDSDTLKLKKSYFNTGKLTMVWSDKTKKFVMYTRTISDLANILIDSGFVIEKLLEPDSRKRYPYDSFYGLWDYTPKLLKMIPPTIIFKARKK